MNWKLSAMHEIDNISLQFIIKWQRKRNNFPGFPFPSQQLSSISDFLFLFHSFLHILSRKFFTFHFFFSSALFFLHFLLLSTKWETFVYENSHLFLNFLQAFHFSPFKVALNSPLRLNQFQLTQILPNFFNKLRG